MNTFHSLANRLSIFLAITLMASLPREVRGQAAAPQDIAIGVTYICNGKHIYIENCNIGDTSDASNCMVAHPDHLTIMNAIKAGAASSVRADVNGSGTFPDVPPSRSTPATPRP